MFRYIIYWVLGSQYPVINECFVTYVLHYILGPELSISNNKQLLCNLCLTLYTGSLVCYIIYRILGSQYPAINKCFVTFVLHYILGPEVSISNNKQLLCNLCVTLYTGSLVSYIIYWALGVLHYILGPG